MRSLSSIEEAMVVAETKDMEVVIIVEVETTGGTSEVMILEMADVEATAAAVVAEATLITCE